GPVGRSPDAVIPSSGSQVRCASAPQFPDWRKYARTPLQTVMRRSFERLSYLVCLRQRLMTTKSERITATKTAIKGRQTFWLARIQVGCQQGRRRFPDG